MQRQLDSIKGIDVFFVDGIFLVWMLRLMGVGRFERASFDMTSLAPTVFNDAIDNNKTIYFIGSKKHEISKAVDEIKKAFPNINIIRYRDGYFTGTERADELDLLIDMKPDGVVAGLGVPLQEDFLIDLRGRGWKGTGFTCGGFLHQTAGGIQYYPKWMDKLNLRWLYRIYDEPKLLRRYTIDYTKFLFLFAFDVFKLKFQK
jgi:N-acetylglucosaminyldiphosphoundecaprenol N-acetyl-beta-D-mannosaminyltransferase